MKKLISTKMKIFMVFLLITSITCFTSSMVVLYNSNFKLSDYINWNSWDHWNFGWDYNNYNYNDYTHTILDESLTDIQNLNLDFNGLDVIFQINSGNTLTVNGRINYEGYNSIDALNINRDNGTLTISPKNIHTSLLVKIPSSYTNNLSLKLTTGSVDLSDMTLQSLITQSVSSDLNLTNITCTTGNISTSNGNIVLNNFTSTDLSADTLHGEIYSTGLKGSVNLKTISGDIFSSLTNDVTGGKFNSTNGSINLDLPLDNNFLIDYNTVNGDFNTVNNDFEPHPSTIGNYDITSTNRNSKISMGTGTIPISITTIDGDLSF